MRFRSETRIMATAKIFLDTRATAPGDSAPLKIQIIHRRHSCNISLGFKVKPEQLAYDDDGVRIINHPMKRQLTSFIREKVLSSQMTILELARDGRLDTMSAMEIKRRILCPDEKTNENDGNNLFLVRFKSYMESRTAAGTRAVYMHTLKKMSDFDHALQTRRFEDINKEWLRSFEKFLCETSNSANGRAIHLRNIRAVFNDAIDDEVTSFYPFRKFRIKTQTTIKRSMTVQELRTLMTFRCEPYQEQYRDMFSLMFMLCGINAVDLFNATPEAMSGGRLEYVRAKTHKPYSIKIEPEAMHLIEKYKGKRFLVNIMDTRESYRDYLRRMDRELKKIGPVERHGLGGKKDREPLFPRLSQYWCRHTWATIAAELDIPKETIAAGLGHEMGNSTTSIYINFNQRKIDEANRKIIDYVLYGRK